MLWGIPTWQQDGGRPRGEIMASRADLANGDRESPFRVQSTPVVCGRRILKSLEKWFGVCSGFSRDLRAINSAFCSVDTHLCHNRRAFFTDIPALAMGPTVTPALFSFVAKNPPTSVNKREIKLLAFTLNITLACFCVFSTVYD